MDFIASASSEGMLCIWSTDSNSIAKIPLPSISKRFGAPKLISCKNENNFAVYGCNTILRWSYHPPDCSLEPLPAIVCPHGNGDVISICFSPDGCRIASGHNQGTLCYWNVETGEVLWSLNAHDMQNVCGVDICCNGTLLVSCGDNDQIRLCDTESGQELCRLLGHNEGVHVVQFNVDGTKFASCSRDSTTICVWDVSTFSIAQVLDGHSNGVTSISYSPDSSRLASSSYDKSVIIWDTENGVQLFTLMGHTNCVHSVAFNSDGSRLASAGIAKVVIVWDCVTGQEIIQLEGHHSAVTSVCFLSSMPDFVLK